MLLCFSSVWFPWKNEKKKLKVEFFSKYTHAFSFCFFHSWCKTYRYAIENRKKKQIDGKVSSVFLCLVWYQGRMRNKKRIARNDLKISRQFLAFFSLFLESQTEFKTFWNTNLSKHLSKNKLGSSRGSERELVPRKCTRRKLLWLARYIFGYRIGGTRRRSTSWLGSHAWIRRMIRRRRSRRSQSFGDFKSRSTPWPRQKLHWQSWALRQLGSAARGGPSTSRVPW
jgi:hypothetical protein